MTWVKYRYDFNKHYYYVSCKNQVIAHDLATSLASHVNMAHVSLMYEPTIQEVRNK